MQIMCTKMQFCPSKTVEVFCSTNTMVRSNQPTTWGPLNTRAPDNMRNYTPKSAQNELNIITVHPRMQWKNRRCILTASPCVKIPVQVPYFDTVQVWRLYVPSQFVLHIINIAKCPHLCSWLSLKISLLAFTILFLKKRKLSFVACEWLTFNVLVQGVKTLDPKNYLELQ